MNLSSKLRKANRTINKTTNTMIYQIKKKITQIKEEEP